MGHRVLGDRWALEEHRTETALRYRLNGAYIWWTQEYIIMLGNTPNMRNRSMNAWWTSQPSLHRVNHNVAFCVAHTPWDWIMWLWTQVVSAGSPTSLVKSWKSLEVCQRSTASAHETWEHRTWRDRKMYPASFSTKNNVVYFSTKIFSQKDPTDLFSLIHVLCRCWRVHGDSKKRLFLSIRIDPWKNIQKHISYILGYVLFKIKFETLKH